MKKTGYDYFGKYEYYDIKEFNTCCTCKYFYDNKMETRLECLKEVQDEKCYENKFEE